MLQLGSDYKPCEDLVLEILLFHVNLPRNREGEVPGIYQARSPH